MVPHCNLPRLVVPDTVKVFDDVFPLTVKLGNVVVLVATAVLSVMYNEGSVTKPIPEVEPINLILRCPVLFLHQVTER